MSMGPKNKFNFWSVREIMNTSGLLQMLRKGFIVALQETRNFHNSRGGPSLITFFLLVDEGL